VRGAGMNGGEEQQVEVAFEGFAFHTSQCYASLYDVSS
jgi:hypothetical protein